MGCKGVFITRTCYPDVEFILYSLCHGCLQVIPQYNDGRKRFSDNLDRLYITTGAFDNDNIFTDDIIGATGSVLFSFDKESRNDVPELMTGAHTIKLFWRTVVQFQSTSRDLSAAGFRLLAYPTGKRPYSASLHVLFI